MAMPLQHQIISRALEIVSDERTWTRGAMARTHFGRPCAVWDLAAVSFCAVGALARAAFELLGPNVDATVVEIAETYVLAANCAGHLSLPGVNENDGREAIVRMFTRALAALEPT